ncbi:hypothetical protein M758_UG300400 [Ceratodon purpureus]|nr:hypothetical protein M758_UG300400 [Ceratodon purpureus]
MKTYWILSFLNVVLNIVLVFAGAVQYCRSNLPTSSGCGCAYRQANCCWRLAEKGKSSITGTSLYDISVASFLVHTVGHYVSLCLFSIWPMRLRRGMTGSDCASDHTFGMTAVLICIGNCFLLRIIMKKDSSCALKEVALRYYESGMQL